MTTPQTMVHNAITGEIVTRNFNASELAQAEADKIAQDQAAADAKASASARQAVLDKLGITADEAKLLLG